MRMVVTDDFTGDFGAFAMRIARRQFEVVHRDDDTPLRGFHPIARIGQRAGDDHAHRITQVGILHFIDDGEVVERLGQGRRIGCVRHPVESSTSDLPAGDFRITAGENALQINPQIVRENGVSSERSGD